MTSTDSIEEFEKVSSADGSEAFACIFCRKQFNGTTQAKRHLTMIHRKKPFDCTECTEKFRQYSDLLDHVQGHRRRVKPEEPKSEDPSPGLHRCQVCPAEFRSRSSFRDHLNKHAGIVPKRDPVTCEKCDAVFKSREGRRVHMILKHDEGVTHKCDQCLMVFARKANLRLHMTTHGVRPHVCSVCGKSFARIDSLRLHEQSCASGEAKGLSCAECGQRFRKPELLEKHRERGHPEKDHQCGHCGQSFETKRALSHHVRVHEGQFRCGHCPLQFVTDGALKNHERSRHWEALGVERLVGKQGRRKGAEERPKEPKVRVRRNKHNPFIGLEHLREKEAMVGESREENVPKEVDPVEPVEKVAEIVMLPEGEKYFITEEPSQRDESPNTAIIKEEDIKSEPSDDEDNNDAFPMDNDPQDTASERDIFEDIESGKEEQPDGACSPVLEKPKPKRNNANQSLRRKSYAKNPAEHPCQKCNRAFVYPFHLKRHMAKDHGIGSVPKPQRLTVHCCRHCERYFSTWRTLVAHLKKVHDETVEESQLVRCATCLRKFVSAEDLDGHSCLKGWLVDRERRFKCELCDKAYVNQYGLDCHRSAHPEYHKVSCDECQRSFASDKDLQVHRRRVHVEASHICQECGRGFKGPSQLKIHVQIHQKEKGYCCEFCGKSFSQRNGMTAHLRIYHPEQVGEKAVAEREITCEYCSKKIKGKGCYKLHLKMHTNDRKYPCNFCELRFITKQDLARHEMRHTKQYRFKCRFCGKGATRQKSIAIHESRVHNWPSPYQAMQFNCSSCGRTFGSKSALKMHETLHVEGLPVPCKVCDRRFKNTKYMIYHMKVHHLGGRETQKPRKKRSKASNEAAEVAPEVEDPVEFKPIEIHENPLPSVEEQDVVDSNAGSMVIFPTMEVKPEIS